MLKARSIMVALFVLSIFLISVQPAEMGGQAVGARAVLRDGAGNVVGTVTFTQVDQQVRVSVTASGLPAGWHGFHIHGMGDCTPPGHTTAGAHWNPASVSHPNHPGDMPLLYVNKDGTAEASFKTDRFTVAELFDADGSAVIVHGSPDNYANIDSRYTSSAAGGPANGPDASTLGTGDAGARIACGVIQRPDGKR
jgi:Cu-Zn family superoxide dismutase